MIENMVRPARFERATFSSGVHFAARPLRAGSDRFQGISTLADGDSASVGSRPHQFTDKKRTLLKNPDALRGRKANRSATLPAKLEDVRRRKPRHRVERNGSLRQSLEQTVSAPPGTILTGSPGPPD